MARFTNVCFTLNNWTVEDKVKLVANEYIQYICYGEEVGESGTPHLQGYCEFTRQYVLKVVKKVLGDKVHFEVRRGTQKQAIDYCMKEGVFFEDGEKKESGKRNDLIDLKHSVDQGVPLGVIVNSCKNFQQIRYTEKLFEYKPVSLEYKKRQVFWHYGTTGTGKTRAVYDFVKNLRETDENIDLFRSNLGGGQWFSGYCGQQVALLDEVRAGKWPYSQLLELLDGYEIRIPTKGGFTMWNPPYVFITSPMAPMDCYKGQLEFGDGTIDQLLRRITEIKEFKDMIEPESVEPMVPSMFLKRNHEEAFYAEMDEALEDYCERNHHGKRGDQ